LRTWGLLSQIGELSFNLSALLLALLVSTVKLAINL
jgi:hypothetical protein